MITQSDNRGLIFIHTGSRVRVGGIVVLLQIPAVCIVLLDLKINGVLRRDLRLECSRELALLNVVVHLLAVVGAVESFHGIAEVFIGAELRARLCPGTAAQIFRARNNPQPVALEQGGIFLL